MSNMNISVGYPTPTLVSEFFTRCAQADSSMRSMSAEAWIDFADDFPLHGIHTVWNGKDIIAIAYAKTDQNRSQQVRHCCIFVQPDYRRRGIGTGLLSYIRQEFDSPDDQLETGLHPGWLAGESFLKKHGFVLWDSLINMELNLSGRSFGLKVSPEESSEYRIRSISSGETSTELASVHNAAHQFESLRTAKDFQKIIADHKRVILVIEHKVKKGLCGFIEYYWEPDRSGWINNIAITPIHQRKGLARMLMTACFQDFVRQATESIALHCYKRNHSALRLYESVGFESINTTPIYWG